MSANQFEPPADLRVAAASMRQLYNALTQEGFTRNEAMQIIATVLQGVMEHLS
jgi:hypothetical protein